MFPQKLTGLLMNKFYTHMVGSEYNYRIYHVIVTTQSQYTKTKKSTADVYGFMTGNYDRISLRKACRDTETA